MSLTLVAMPAWCALGLGIAAGVLVGMGGGGLLALVAGALVGASLGLVRQPAVRGVAAGCAAAIAALGSSGANDGSWKTFAVALTYGAVAGVVIRVAPRLRRPRVAAVAAGAGVVVALLGATALPSPRVPMTGTTDRAARAAGMTATTLRRVDAFVRAELRRNHYPGVAIAIVADGRAVLERGYGVADTSRRAMTADTPQIVASLSKPMTAVAVATLVEAGKVDFDAPVQRYLPWFRVADSAASRTMTVRQILTHTSGLGERASSAWAALARTSGHTLADEVRALREVPLDFAPGTDSAYSNANYQIAGLIVQVVSGEPFGRYLEDHVLRPARMTSSFAARYAPKRVAPASGFHGWFGVPIAEHQTFSDPAKPSGSVYSTAHDLGSFLLSHLGRADLGAVTPTMYTTLHQPVFGDHGNGMDWGIWTTDRGTARLAHSGHAPGATSVLVADPKARWGVAVILNQQELVTITADEIGHGIGWILEGGGVPTVHTRARTHVQDGLFAALVVALVARAATTLGRWRRPLSRRALVLRSAWLVFVGVVFPLAIVAWVRANDYGRLSRAVRLASVYAPDEGMLLLVTIVGCVGFAVARAVTLLRVPLR